LVTGQRAPKDWLCTSAVSKRHFFGAGASAPCAACSKQRHERIGYSRSASPLVITPFDKLRHILSDAGKNRIFWLA